MDEKNQNLVAPFISCNEILHTIPLEVFQYYVQSNTVDEGTHNQILTLLCILAIKYTDNTLDEKFIDLLGAIFSDFIIYSKKKNKILTLAASLSRSPMFFEKMKYDKSFEQIINFLSSSNNALIQLSLRTLKNILIYNNVDLENCLWSILPILTSNIANDKTIIEACKFIIIFFMNNTPENHVLVINIFKCLMEIFDKYAIKVRYMISTALLTIINHLNKYDFIEIDLNSLISIMIDLFEFNDNDISNNTLIQFDNIFQILSDTESFPNAKEIFEMNNGLEMIYTLKDTTNSDDLKEYIDIFLLRNFPPQ